MALSGLVGAFFRASQKHLLSLPRISVCCAQQSGLGTSDGGGKKIKRPLTPYVRFFQEKYTELEQTYSGLKSTELAKKAGELWKNLPESDKEAYKEVYRVERSEFNQTWEALSDKDKQEHAEARKETLQKRAKIRKSKLLKSLNKPKRPLGAFFLYVQSQPIERGEAEITKYMSGVAEQWKRMPEQEKEKYELQSKQAYREYEDALSAWEDEMLEQGKTELVRVSRRPKPPKEAKGEGTPKSKKKGSKTKKKKPVVDEDPSWMREE